MHNYNINKNKKKAFTLIELLIVIAIIGLLSTLVIAALGPARSKARDAKRKGDLVAIQKAMEMYKDSNSTQESTTSTASLGSFIQGGFPKPVSDNYPYYICRGKNFGTSLDNLRNYLIAVRLENAPNPYPTLQETRGLANTTLQCIKIDSNLNISTILYMSGSQPYLDCVDDVYCIYSYK